MNDDMFGLQKVNIAKTGQWYLMFCSRTGSPTPHKSTDSGILTSMRSKIDCEFSV